MKIKILKLDQRAKMPTLGSPSAAGADIYALEGFTVKVGETVLAKTGLAAEIPEGYVGLMCARSGIALKRGLAPANKVGIVDSDYRGELMVAIHNHSNTDQSIEAGERMAQLVIVPYLRAEYELADTLSETSRGEGGFGSTGKM